MISTRHQNRIKEAFGRGATRMMMDGDYEKPHEIVIPETGRKWNRVWASAEGFPDAKSIRMVDAEDRTLDTIHLHTHNHEAPEPDPLELRMGREFLAAYRQGQQDVMETMLQATAQSGELVQAMAGAMVELLNVQAQMAQVANERAMAAEGRADEAADLARELGKDSDVQSRMDSAIDAAVNIAVPLIQKRLNGS